MKIIILADNGATILGTLNLSATEEPEAIRTHNDPTSKYGLQYQESGVFVSYYDLWKRILFIGLKEKSL